MSDSVSHESVGVIIAAGGAGTRFNSRSSLPKQFHALAGLPVYMHALLAFYKHDAIDSIVITVPERFVEEVKQEIGETIASSNIYKDIAVIVGGTSRQESVFKGLRYFSCTNKPPELVIIHDAARPLLSSSLISQVVECVRKEGACTVGYPVTDTLKTVSDNRIKSTLDRSSIFAVQTPQAGRFDWLLKAHEELAARAVNMTDDAAVLEFMGHSVSLIMSDRHNIKVTEKADLALCEAILAACRRHHM